MNIPSAPASRPGTVGVLVGVALVLSGPGHRALGQEDPIEATTEADLPPVTTYVEMQIPPPPWLGSDAPPIPSWLNPGDAASPFLRPGLGTTSVGPPPLAGFSGRPPSSPMRLGPVDLWPRLGTQMVYGTGLLSGPGREQATWLSSITPGMTLAAGDHWTLGYDPTVQVYSDDAYKNTVDHSITLGWRTDWKNWAFRASHGTAITSDPLVETAAQTDQTTHSTGLGATWNLGNKGTFDFSLNQNLRLTSAYTDSYSWASQNWYDYQWRPKLRVGIGVGVGYDMMEPGTDMSNQRLNVRVSWRVGDKVTVAAGGGGEWRSFYGVDADVSVSPLVNASLSYQVLERTAVSVGFSHDIGVSYFSDQFTENTSIQGGATQFLSRRWSVYVNGGFRFTTYQQASAGTETSREDGSTFVRAGVNARVGSRVTATLAYSFTGNSSDQSAYSFDSNQFILGLNWAL